MTRDPICGMSGVFERHGYGFCSERCLAEFERRQQAARQAVPTRRLQVSRRVVRDPWVWVSLTVIAFVTAGSWWSAAAPVSALYLQYLQKIGVPFLVGLLIGGFVDHFVPKEYVVKLLTGGQKRVIGRATLLGFLASTCSHGCLVLAIELYRKGASIPAVVSFLLASPWANMALTLIILSLFGLKGFAIIGGALVVAFVTGVLFQQLSARRLIDTNPNVMAVPEGFSIRRDLSNRWRRYSWTRDQLRHDARGIWRGTVSLGRMVIVWVQLGIISSALLGVFVSHDAFMRFFGPSIGGLFLTLLAATVIEVCSEGTAPLAFELYRHTAALGNAFVFLMAGVVTDYTELVVLWTNIGRRTVFWLLAVSLPLTIGLGWMLNVWR